MSCHASVSVSCCICVVSFSLTTTKYKAMSLTNKMVTKIGCDGNDEPGIPVELRNDFDSPPPTPAPSLLQQPPSLNIDFKADHELYKFLGEVNKKISAHLKDRQGTDRTELENLLLNPKTEAAVHLDHAIEIVASVASDAKDWRNHKHSIAKKVISLHIAVACMGQTRAQIKVSVDISSSVIQLASMAGEIVKTGSAVMERENLSTHNSLTDFRSSLSTSICMPLFSFFDFKKIVVADDKSEQYVSSKTPVKATTIDLIGKRLELLKQIVDVLFMFNDTTGTKILHHSPLPMIHYLSCSGVTVTHYLKVHY